MNTTVIADKLANSDFLTNAGLRIGGEDLRAEITKFISAVDHAVLFRATDFKDALEK